MDTEEKQLVSQEPATKMLTDDKDMLVYLLIISLPIIIFHLLILRIWFNLTG